MTRYSSNGLSGGKTLGVLLQAFEAEKFRPNRLFELWTTCEP
jgi:hypothetical protein